MYGYLLEYLVLDNQGYLEMTENQNQLDLLSWTVTKAEKGEKLIDILSKHLGDEFSLRKIKRLIELNACNVNGLRERHASRVVYGGEELSLCLRSADREKGAIVFEDENILVINKPVGCVSSLEGLKEFFPDHQFYEELVHRLDKETSGLMVLAKNKSSYLSLVDQFRAKTVQKKYHCLVWGKPSQDKGHIRNNLYRKTRYQGQQIWAVATSSRVRQKLYHSSTIWKKLTEGNGVSLIECRPETGRTHQIRVHMQSMGCPIVADFQYSRNRPCPISIQRMLLHAKGLSFVHPATKKQVFFDLPYPQDFINAGKELKLKGKTWK